jgi:hypothetical protein
MPTRWVPCPGKNIAVVGRVEAFDLVRLEDREDTELKRRWHWSNGRQRCRMGCRRIMAVAEGFAETSRKARNCLPEREIPCLERRSDQIGPLADSDDG